MNLQQLWKYINCRIKNYYPEGEARAMSLLLLEYMYEYTMTDVITRADRLVEVDTKALESAIKQLSEGYPIQYMIGSVQFYDCEFAVNPSVLIPRPETEELVEWILNKDSFARTILDIGTGSGCIAVALAKNMEGKNITRKSISDNAMVDENKSNETSTQLSVMAVDISEAALVIAAANACRNGVDVQFLQADILNWRQKQELTMLKFDLIVSNPPYVCQSEKSLMEQNVLDHEPHTALFVDDDNPLLFYEAITEYAQVALNPCGTLYFEINQAFGEQTSQMLANYGFDCELRNDMSNKPRMVRAWRR